MVFVAPCPGHFYFKERIGSRFENISCNCLNLQKGRCNNCKIICFNINFLADKIKLRHYLNVPSKVDIVPIETYLEKMNSMLFSIFAKDVSRYNVQKSSLDLTCDFFFGDFKKICLIC